MDNMLLEKYASMMQKQAYVNAQQEYGMEKQSFALLGKGLNLAARGTGKGLKLGSNLMARGSKALQKGIGRGGNWAQHAGSAVDNAIVGGVKNTSRALWRGGKAIATHPLTRKAAIAAPLGYYMYGQHNKINDLERQLQEKQPSQPEQPFQPPALPAPNHIDPVAQWGGTMGNMPVQQPTLQQGLTSSFNYNPAGQFNPYGM